MEAMDRIVGFDAQMLLQIGMQLLNTLILCSGLSYLLYKPVLGFLKARSDKISTQIKTAQSQMTEAGELRKKYEQKLQSVEKERVEILESARKRGQEREAQIISQAQEEAQTIKNRALLDIERERAKATDDLKKQIIEIASLMAGQYVVKEMDQTTQNKLLDQVITELGDVKWLS